MALDTYALVTLANVKLHLDIDSGDTSQDAILERMINEVSNDIEEYLDRKIIKRQYIEHHDGRNTDRILLRNYPADKPTELLITVDGDYTAPSITPIDLDEYEIDDLGNELIVREQRFTRGNKNIRVTYQAGYLSTEIPRSIEQAAYLLVEFYNDERKDRSIRMQSKSKRDESVKYHDDWPPKIVRLLDPHQRGPFDYISSSITENY